MVAAAGALAATAALIFAALLLEQGICVQGALLDGRYLFYAIIIALANNVDNLGARIAYSMQGTRVDLPINLWISVITFVISASAAFSGAAAMGSFGKNFASVIAMGMLVTLGLAIITLRKQ
jgi:hypothetical protein